MAAIIGNCSASRTIEAFRLHILPNTRDIIIQDGWFRFRTDGRLIPRGLGTGDQYLLLRGVCFGPSAKLPPNLPFRSLEDWTKYETYVDLLLACGFTTLRVPFFWSAFEPACNPVQPEYNEQYLQDFFHYVRLFSSKGFLVLIDLHQDLLGNAFGGNGMPDWVRSEDSQRFSFLKNTPLWGANYEFNRDLRKTFTDFWHNDLTNQSLTPPLVHFPVRDRFLDMVERVAAEAARHERVLGIEIFNEPHPARISDRVFEEEILPEFYAEAIRRIRRHSPDIFAFVSPQSDWNVNLHANKSYDSFLRIASQDDRVVFAYHYYDSILTALGGRVFHDAKQEEYLDAQSIGARWAREHGMAPFLTEFGTRQNWPKPIVRTQMNWQFEAVEQALVNATYWNVNLYNTEELRDGFMREDFSLVGYNKKIRNLDVATRPYVQLASAEPVHSHFNTRTKEFDLVLRGKPMDAPTVIYLPEKRLHPLQPVHYEGGFNVEYNGATEFHCENNQLRIPLDPAVELHKIIIRPRE
ncbi:MAG TPA: cellulase family glycosylhydrolase [Candidatus Kapabacteria bacterium]|nr:cellulase family glycosylhydrolase [Candidatus Kapabacteria bacterium]